MIELKYLIFFSYIGFIRVYIILNIKKVKKSQYMLEKIEKKYTHQILILKKEDQVILSI